jgi:cytochrome c-type biogenesis protein CcmH
MRRLLLPLVFLLAPAFAQAIQPDEVLDDPALEARARAITSELRCVVCQSESIDESNAEIARDLRLLVRERLVAGDGDAEVIDYVVARYGEFVLFRPPFTLANAPLWLAAPMLLVLGGGIALAYIRRQARAEEPERRELAPEEKARLARLLEE